MDGEHFLQREILCLFEPLQNREVGKQILFVCSRHAKSTHVLVPLMVNAVNSQESSYARTTLNDLGTRMLQFQLPSFLFKKNDFANNDESFR